MLNHPNYRVSVEIVILHDGAVLLTKRSSDCIVAPDVWNVPAGKVKYEETPMQALFREAKEEIDAEIDFIRELSVRTFRAETKVEPIYRLVYTYLVRLKSNDRKNVTLNEKHSELCWVTKEELDNPRFASLGNVLRDLIRNVLE